MGGDASASGRVIQTQLVSYRKVAMSIYSSLIVLVFGSLPFMFHVWGLIARFHLFIFLDSFYSHLLYAKCSTPGSEFGDQF